MVIQGYDLTYKFEKSQWNDAKFMEKWLNIKQLGQVGNYDKVLQIGLELL